MKLNQIKKPGLVALPAVFALAVAGCGGGGDAQSEEQAGEVEVADSSAGQATAAAAGGGLVDIEVEFPKPLFQGTPVPVKLGNLEAPGEPRLSFKAPAGVTNLAAGKAVESTDPAPIFGSIDLITDGNKDGADGNYVELGPGQQNITVDLGAPAEIWAVNVWHFHKSAAAYLDVVVQISEDAAFTNPVTIFNNDDDNSAGMGIGEDPAYIETNHGRIIDAEGAKGQFVRLYSQGNTANPMNHYVEVEVWGK